MNASLHHLARTAREGVRTGALRGAALLHLLLSVPPLERDGWADALLGLEDVPPDIPELPRGAVPYLPSGVDEIVRAVLEVPLQEDDVFVDLGSGVGRVSILAHLLSGARATGVELQLPLVACARALCAALALEGLSFVHANAEEVELDGSVFFLYAPFNGEMLARVLRRLEDVARRRPIVLCAHSLSLDGESWLVRRETSSPWLSLYASCVPGVGPRASRPLSPALARAASAL